jgi:hypothetical protein
MQMNVRISLNSGAYGAYELFAVMSAVGLRATIEAQYPNVVSFVVRVHVDGIRQRVAMNLEPLEAGRNYDVDIAVSNNNTSGKFDLSQALPNFIMVDTVFNASHCRPYSH